MNTKQILETLKKSGSESIKKVLLKHGAKEPFYGVKIEDIKKIQKTIKSDHQKIAEELFETGISDAQYMAGLMADGAQMTTKQLNTWAEASQWGMLSEYSVPWVTCENDEAMKIALKWIDSKKPNVAVAGWNTIACVCTTWSNEDLDIELLRKLFTRVEKEIATAPNRVKYCMNNFIISAGSYVQDLNKEAKVLGKKLGAVEVDMNGTACKVPFAPEYIDKSVARGSLTKKKKTAKC